MWQIELAKGLAKAAMPFPGTVRRLKRTLRPYRADPANSHLACRQGLEQIRLLREAGADLGGVVMELGTGWLPTVPLLFHLAGARRLILTDVQRLMDATTRAEAKRVVLANEDLVRGPLGLSPAAFRERLERMPACDYLVPWDPAALPEGSVDVLISRTVLEHIPAPVLEDYAGAFRRILRPGGVMCHLIDNSDHWQHHDRRLGRLHFLRYDDDWRWWLLCLRRYQNRLRHSDYLALFARHGWQAAAALGEPDAASLRDLATLPLAPRFRFYAPEDLAILTSLLVLRRPADA